MLLIEHDQTQSTQGQKNRRAGTHHQQGLAPGGLQAGPPNRHPLPLGHATVVFEHQAAEAAAAAIQKLGDQADFGGEQQHAAASL